MVSDKFPGTEKVVTWTAFFMDLIDFYGFQTSKLAVICWFPPTFDVHQSLVELFPLNCSGRLGCNIQSDTVDMLNLIDNTGADLIENIIGNACPVSCHSINGSNCSYNNGIVIGSLITHHTYRMNIREACEVLPDFSLQACISDFFSQNGIGFSDNFQFFLSDFP